MSRHPFDTLSFVAGAVFVVLALAFLVDGHAVVDNVRWVWPALLLTVGGAGLASALRRRDD